MRYFKRNHDCLGEMYRMLSTVNINEDHRDYEYFNTFKETWQPAISCRTFADESLYEEITESDVVLELL
jgi:hypothetical protein